MKIKRVIILASALFLFVSCTKKPGGNIGMIPAKPKIEPDYSGITIPFNIATLNFAINEAGDYFTVTVKNENGDSLAVSNREGIIRFPVHQWRKLLEKSKDGKLNYRISVRADGEWTQYEPFTNLVSGSPVAPYLYYRLLFPGFESWSEISIVQRSLESFGEKAVVKNNAVKQNYVNFVNFKTRRLFSLFAGND